MNFPPDFTMPVTEFVDECNVIVTPENPDTMMPFPLACPSSYHEASGMCTMDEEQNSHQELLAVYGAADPAILTDTTAPEIGTVDGLPEEGAVLPAGSEVDLSAMVSDDSGIVSVRIAYESTALEIDFGAPGGVVDKCTAGACGVQGQMQLVWDAGVDLAYPDQAEPFGFTELPALPGGDYTITIEASDLAGNLATPITVNFTVEGGAADTGGADTSGGNDDNVDDNGDDNNDDSNDDNGDSSGDDDVDDGNVNDDGGEGGCSCTTDGNAGHAAFLLFGVAGLAIGRRRRVA